MTHITEPKARNKGGQDTVPTAMTAVAEACDAHRLLLLAVALGVLRNRSSAEDAIQDAVAKTIAAGRNKEILDPKAYLVTAVRHAALDIRSKESKNVVAPIDEITDREVLSEEPQPDRILEGRQKISLMVAAIEDLPPQCRQVFIMSRIEGLSLDEISRRLGISKSTIHKHLAKAVIRCSEYLEQYGYDDAHKDDGSD